MARIEQPRKLGGPGYLAFTMLFVTPSALALFVSRGLVHGTFHSASAAWFVYETSFYLGVAGIVLGAALIIAGVIRRRISATFLWLMAVAVSAAVFCEWYATHIFRDPWTS